MDDMLDILEALARQAGDEILKVREEGFSVQSKEDESPVTIADQRAEAIILAGLANHYPQIPVVAEEAVSEGEVPNISTGTFFLVDPLDGTKEFVSGGTDFTVNIALIENNVPVCGVVHVPARSVLYRGGPDGAVKVEDGTSTPITCNAGEGKPRIVASKSHRTSETDDWISKIGECEIVSVGSSLKFCLLAEGAADYYPRFGRTMEWDTAAGDAVVRAAGGNTYFLSGETFTYGKKLADDVAFANPFFIARGALPLP